MLPAPTADDAGDASFLGPSRAPTQKADVGARQRPQKEQPNKSSPQASPETQMQQSTVNSSVLWLGLARARAQEGPKTNGTKARSPPLSTAVYLAARGESVARAHLRTLMRIMPVMREIHGVGADTAGDAEDAGDVVL